MSIWKGIGLSLLGLILVLPGPVDLESTTKQRTNLQEKVPLNRGASAGAQKSRRKRPLPLKRLPEPARCPSRPYWVFESPVVPFEDLNFLMLKDLTIHSNVIVDATAKSLEVCPPPVSGASNVTYVTFLVNELVAGDLGDEVQITLPVVGGCSPTLCEDFSGQPQFAREERYILFLRKGRPFPFAGWTEGIFRVRAGRVFNYHGQPLVQIRQASTKMVFNTAVPAQPAPIDSEIYGGMEEAQGKMGESRYCIECSDYVEASLPSLPAVPMEIGSFVSEIRRVRERETVRTVEGGRLVSPSTPFQYGPHTAVSAGGP